MAVSGLSPALHTEPVPKLKKELGLPDLILAQVLCVVGSAWVGVAAKLGKAHLAFWLGAMLLYYLPLAAVVIYLNREMPLEGGLYQWAKAGFGEFLGFLTAWNLWAYAVVCVASVLFVVPTDLSYMIGPGAEWLPGNAPATVAIIGAIVLAIALVAVRGLAIGKWLHNVGAILILVAYVILLGLPLFARHSPGSYVAFPWQTPAPNWFSLAVFGQMTIGALSGFEYVAIMAGECRNPVRSIGRSVSISAPIIALMFILGTSSVLAFVGNQPINLIGPIPQTFRLALGATGIGGRVAPFAILLLLTRAVAAASLLFTGLTRLPMAAGWDHLLPSWFTRLHPRWRTPVNSIVFVAIVVLLLVVLSMLGVHEQEAMQLLQNGSITQYGMTYVALFALPIWGAVRVRRGLPLWVRAASFLGFVSSLVAVLIAVYPIIEVSNRWSYAAKIIATIAASNLLALWIYRRGRKARAIEAEPALAT
ncbi:MAG TPA: APC family permease [Bryobacteraceae bacterium]|jgi:amino acid transporter|nr:APC family permease [Bryobacteraceae bacterium]